MRLPLVDLERAVAEQAALRGSTVDNVYQCGPRLFLLRFKHEGKAWLRIERQTLSKLPISGEGAYLVICRGDNLYTSGLILITPLKLEIQETPAEGSVRVNVRDLTAAGNYIPEVLVKVVGTNNDLFFSGHTDLRGVFQADGVNGTATVLARAEGGKYAFYRGQKTHGTPPKPNAAAQEQTKGKRSGGKKQLQQSDYLKNIDVQIPLGVMTCVTGVSGSGKSSLAFDTIFAEGQRRYVESLSAYARQFIGQMEKPKYDTIRGLSPTISIEQKSASKNPRSTVGTITEIYDYLRRDLEGRHATSLRTRRRPAAGEAAPARGKGAAAACSPRPRRRARTPPAIRRNAR